MPARSKTRLRSSSAKLRPVPLLQDVREQAEVLVDVGEARARRELQRARRRRSRGRPRRRRTAPRRASRAASPPPSSRAGPTGCGRAAARVGRRLRQPRQARAHVARPAPTGSGKASSTRAQVNCLVIEHMRNSVRGVKGMRRSAFAQPQAWRTSTSPSRSTATAPPGPGKARGRSPSARSSWAASVVVMATSFILIAQRVKTETRVNAR